MRETSPRFGAILRRRWWHEWPGLVGIATGLALWAFIALGVVAPLADAVARFRSPTRAFDAGSCPDLDEAIVEAAHGTMAEPRVCASSESGAVPLAPAGG